MELSSQVILAISEAPNSLNSAETYHFIGESFYKKTRCIVGHSVDVETTALVYRHHSNAITTTSTILRTIITRIVLTLGRYLTQICCENMRRIITSRVISKIYIKLENKKKLEK
jgi:hypothetical protein